MNVNNSGVWIGNRCGVVLAKVDHFEWAITDASDELVAVDWRTATTLVVYTDRVDQNSPLELDIANGDADKFLMALATYWETRS